jgi:hypothetical protein
MQVLIWHRAIRVGDFVVHAIHIVNEVTILVKHCQGFKGHQAVCINAQLSCAFKKKGLAQTKLIQIYQSAIESTKNFLHPIVFVQFWLEIMVWPQRAGVQIR